jgi:DNA-binding response OmpR family regulator
MKALIVEDNKLISGVLEKNLRHDYYIDVVETGNEAITLASTNEYDIILLDLGLPDIDGSRVCTQIRKDNNTVPIIVSSGLSAIQTKVEMLNIGADDYLVKPYNLNELRARMQVALRHKANIAPNGILEIGRIRINPQTRTVTCTDRVIELRRKEYDILNYLAHNCGQVLSRQMIMDHVWSTDSNLWANVVDVHVKHIRDKIGRPYSSMLLKTIHGVGYKLERIE